MHQHHSPPPEEPSPESHLPEKHSPIEADAPRSAWLVYVALILGGGFLAGWLSVPLRFDDVHWWSNARVWLIATPFILAVALYLVRFIAGRWVRRSMQFSIIASLGLHLLLLMAVMEVVVFRNIWLDPKVASRRHDQPVVVPQYHASQLDSQRHASQDFQQPVETAPAEQPPEEQERQSPTQETPPEMQVRSTPAERPPEVREMERQSAEKASPRLNDRRSLAPRANQQVERPQPKAAEAPMVLEEKSPAPVAAPQAINRQPSSASPAARRQQAEHSLPSAPHRETPLQRRAAAKNAPSRPVASEAKPIPRTSVAKSRSATTIAAAPALREVAESRPSLEPQQTSARRTESTTKSPVDLQPLGPAVSQNSGAAPAQSLTRNRREASARISSASQASRRASLATTRVAPAAAVRALTNSVAAGSSSSATASSRSADALAPATSNHRRTSATSASPREVREVALAGRGPSSLSLADATSFSAGSAAANSQTAGRRLGGAQRRGAASAAPTLADASGSAGRERRRPAFSGGGASAAKISTDVPQNATGLAATNNAETSSTAADSLPGGVRGRGEQAAASANVDGLSGAVVREMNLAGPAMQSLRRATPTNQQASLGDVASLDAAAAARGAATRRRPAMLQVGPATGAALPGAALSDDGASEAVASRRSTAGPENGVLDGLSNNSLERRAAPAAAAAAAAAAVVGRSMQVRPSGADRVAALDVGSPSRRSRQDRVTLSTQDARFPRRSSGAAANLDVSVVTAAEAFSARSRRLQSGSKPGGGRLSPETEAAIERGLEFLARRQQPDGRWSLTHAAERRSERAVLASDTAATALALLSFQGAGYHHKDHRYRLVVGRGLEFLVKNQHPNGDLFVAENELSNRSVWLYSHGIAALALSEAYGMTQDPQLRDPAQRALNFIAQSQQPDLGGWRYSPGQSADTSVTGWMMMALKSGQLAGLETPPGVFEKIEKWLDAAQASPDEPYRYRYNPQAPDTPEQRHGREPTPSMTAVGLLMRFYTGWRRDDENMLAGAQQLLKNPPEIGARRDPKRDTYYWYYATQVMFHMGGDGWKAWNGALHPLLINSQATSGSLSGSWDPRRPTPDRWGPHGGRLYVTAMNLLSLEVHYRHLPLYEATAP